MSWKASAWAKEQRLGSPSAKSILLCLADYADAEDAACWPSQAVLAGDAEVSERTAREWLQRLEEWGLIERERRQRPNGARASDRIVLRLDRAVTDGDERLRRIKAGDACLPAESAGRTNRQSDADPTGNEEQPTGNQFRASTEEPPIEPPTEPLTQGAQAREREGFAEDRKAVERAFERAWQAWPTSVSDSRPDALKAWLRLDPAEREAAGAEAERYVAAVKAVGRKLVCAHAVYLREKRWEQLPPAAAQAAPSVAQAAPFGKAWMAERLCRLLAGREPNAPIPVLTATERQLVEAGRMDEATLMRAKVSRYGWPSVNRMHEMASGGCGATVTARMAAAGAGFEAVRIGGERWQAWQAEHERRGWPWLPDAGRHEWAYFPAGGPDGLDAFEAALAGEAREAAE